MRAFALLLLTALVLVPSVSAQNQPYSVSGKADTPDGRVMPETGQVDVKLLFNVQCAPFTVVTEPVTLVVKARQVPAFATMQLSPQQQTHQFQPQECMSTSGAQRTFVVMASIRVARDAPAFMDGMYEVQAQAIPGSGYNAFYPGRPEAVVQFTVKNDYYTLTQVEPAVLSMELAPRGQGVLPITITNLGNGPTRVVTEIEILEGSDLRRAFPGPEVRLESRAGRGETAAYRAPTYINVDAGTVEGISAFRALFRSSYDGAALDTMTEETSFLFKVVVREGAVDGSEDADPSESLDPALASAPMAPILALVLAGVAAVRRRWP